ncbi:Membrane protein YcjF [hydrothermal vent metagenome]|uniref:Membrane protein YcjF n=1 Tax=hydrothermal vent metagenome TaxID=652676 RepID=A0A3B1E0G6_9ZZZZ
MNIKTYEDEKEVALSILNHYKHHQSQEVRDKATMLYTKIESNGAHSPFLDIKKDIIDTLDKKATSIIYKSAKEVSLFTAFSPGSALDSMAVIFSSMKLMKKIFHVYGYKTNLFTSLLIIRKILENASFAALMEYADDSVNDLLGNTIISKLSTKIAQGVGNGVLMLRIGNMIIQSARPFASDGSIGTYKNMVKLFIKYVKEKVGKKK